MQREPMHYTQATLCRPASIMGFPAGERGPEISAFDAHPSIHADILDSQGNVTSHRCN